MIDLQNRHRDSGNYACELGTNNEHINICLLFVRSSISINAQRIILTMFIQ